MEENLQEITADSIKEMDRKDKMEAIQKRKEWLQKVRRQDVLEINRKEARIYRFKQKRNNPCKTRKLNPKKIEINWKRIKYTDEFCILMRVIVTEFGNVIISKGIRNIIKEKQSGKKWKLKHGICKNN